MRPWLKFGWSVAIALSLLQALSSQELAPRAYVITPLHANAITLTYSFYDGTIDYNGALPISGATGTYSVPILSYYHAFSFFGRSANVVASVPYAVGNFQGTVTGAETHLYRSGLLVDHAVRPRFFLRAELYQPLRAEPAQQVHHQQRRLGGHVSPGGIAGKRQRGQLAACAEREIRFSDALVLADIHTAVDPGRKLDSTGRDTGAVGPAFRRLRVIRRSNQRKSGQCPCSRLTGSYPGSTAGLVL